MQSPSTKKKYILYFFTATKDDLRSSKYKQRLCHKETHTHEVNINNIIIIIIKYYIYQIT